MFSKSSSNIRQGFRQSLQNTRFAAGLSGRLLSKKELYSIRAYVGMATCRKVCVGVLCCSMLVTSGFSIISYCFYRRYLQRSVLHEGDRYQISFFDPLILSPEFRETHKRRPAEALDSSSSERRLLFHVHDCGFHCI